MYCLIKERKKKRFRFKTVLYNSVYFVIIELLRNNLKYTFRITITILQQLVIENYKLPRPQRFRISNLIGGLPKIDFLMTT